MIIAILFWTFLLSSCGIIAICGARSERIFVSLLWLGVSFSTVIELNYGVSGSADATMFIDFAILCVSALYAAKSDKYWPIWFTGFHLNTIATRVAFVLLPGSLPGIYMSLAAVWALPALGIAAYGCLRDHRALSDEKR